jgi:hypothetical protein
MATVYPSRAQATRAGYENAVEVYNCKCSKVCSKKGQGFQWVTSKTWKSHRLDVDNALSPRPDWFTSPEIGYRAVNTRGSSE